MKYLPKLDSDNEIYNSQLGIMFFLVCFFSKLSSLPSLLSESVGSSTLYCVIAYCLFELFLFSIIYIFVSKGGIEYLRRRKNKLYRIVLALWFAVIFIKQTVFYAYVVNYVAEELFETVGKAIMLFSVVFPIAYLAIKGIKTIARVTEIIFVFAILLISFDFFFLKTTVNWQNNLPVMSKDFLPLFSNWTELGLWTGESLPFLVLRIKTKKHIPYVSIGVAATLLIIPTVITLAVGIYGNSLFSVGNTIVSFTPFNNLTNSLGRLEWTALIAYLSLLVTALSTHFFATSKILESYGMNRKFGVVLVAMIISIIILAVPNTRTIMRSAKGIVGTVSLVAHLFIPVALLFLLLIEKRKEAKEKQGEPIKEPTYEN